MLFTISLPFSSTYHTKLRCCSTNATTHRHIIYKDIKDSLNISRDLKETYRLAVKRGEP
jgi:hypothetical protein